MQQEITVQYHAPSSHYQIKIHDILEIEESNRKKFLVFSLITPPKAAAFSSMYVEHDTVTLEVDEIHLVEEPEKNIYDVFTYEKKLAKYQHAMSVYHVALDETPKKEALFENGFFSERRSHNHKYQKLAETLSLESAAANKKSFPELYLRFKDILDEGETKESFDQKLAKLSKFENVINIMIQMQHAYYSNDFQQINHLLEERLPGKAQDIIFKLMRAGRDYDKTQSHHHSKLTDEVLHLVQTNFNYLKQKEAQLKQSHLQNTVRVTK